MAVFICEILFARLHSGQWH
uniref:Uncharacterized protein n=1 Tax=Rhizophora mucronata TaxID=61149 RepID=A0A2P2QCM5_RHIMU